MKLYDLRTLSRGQTFIADQSFQGEGASVIALVKTGARDEQQGEFGISHFLEHMVFKGTHKRSAMELTLAFGDLGAQVNAYTSDEQTVYYGTVLKEHVPALHDLLMDMLSPALDQAEFDVEKKVILEEIALYQDRPTYVLYESATEDFFGGKGVGQSVLGTTQSVSDISRETMAGYVDRRYSAPNVVVSICGDIDTEYYAKLTEERLAGLAAKAVSPSPESSPRLHGEERILHHPKNTQAHLLGLSPGPCATDPLRYAAMLIGVIVGDSQNSRLYWELIDSGLAEYASFDTEDKDGVGSWMLSLATNPEQIDEVREKALKVLSNVHGSLTAAELERAKTKSLSRLVMDSELPLGRAMANALSLQYRGEPFVLKEEMANIAAVSLKQCNDLLEKFPIVGPNLYTMLPEKK